MATNEAIAAQADVVIVGGGIVGCAAAYYLAKHGVQAVLFEKDQIGRAQSGRNWGFVRQQGRDPLELPLMIESNRIWSDIDRELGADVEWVQGGNLALATTPDRMGLFEGWCKTAREHGLDTKVLSPAELRQLIPDLQGEWLGGMYTRSDGHAEPRKATQAFADAAAARGARIVEGCTVTSVDTANGAVSGVRYERPLARSAAVDTAVIRAPCVIAAAGAWTAKLVEPLGLSLPVRWVRSTVARTTPVRKITDVGVWAPSVAFRQRRDGTLNLGGGGWADHDITLDSLRHARLFMPNYLKNRKLFQFHVGRPLLADAIARLPGSHGRRHPFAARWALEPAPNPAKAKWTFDEFRRLFPAVGELRITDTWAGYIDATPDAVPVIGPVDQPRGFVFATGFSGHGFALGPIVGRVMAELILDGSTPFDLHAMRYSRFKEGDLADPHKMV
jgi:glycine/D-amino acid oxidase-like deaminating enzyme